MAKLTLSDARQKAEVWFAGKIRDTAANESNDNRRRLIQTLYARQKNTMALLSLVHQDEAKSPAGATPNAPEKWMEILMHPLGDLVGPVLIMAFMLLKWALPLVIAAILMVVRVFLRQVYVKKEPALLPPVDHKPYLDPEELDRFLRMQTDAALTDAAGIADQYTVTLTRERQDVEVDAVELYCALCEARADAPELDALLYPLSILKANLAEHGFEPLPWRPENEVHYDIMPTDDADQLRYPAIRSVTDGAIVRRGLYLRR